MTDQRDKLNISRRTVLKSSVGIAGSLMTLKSALAEVCGLTPPQTPGPFYPLSKIVDNSINDLSLIEGHARHAKGEVIYITGTVRDQACRPIGGALVEIWTAAASGRYPHPNDLSGLELDPDFQGWGEFITGEDGRFAFKTIVPGAYPADENWWRANHVHFKITRRGYRELITQMYFTPDSFEGAKAEQVRRLNDADLILREVPNKESVIVPFRRAASATTVGPLLAYQRIGAGARLVKIGDLVAGAGEKVGDFAINIVKI